MKNRPTKPGCYWWEDSDGGKHVAECTGDMDIRSPYFDEDYDYDVEEFEDLDCFKRWIGPAHPPTTRESVSWFAQQMESKLIENDHKESWRHMTYRDLQRRVGEELDELWKAIFLGEGDVISEASDVANFCMMIADNWRNQDNETR
jgi:hypothetical protein